MSELYANDFATALASAALAGDDHLHVLAASPAALQGGQFRAAVGSELVLVTSGQDTTTWSVTRGVEGTTAAAHAGGASVVHVLTSESLALSRLDGALLFYDEFDRYADGALAGCVPLVGPAWQTSGAQLPAVSGGLLASAGSGYALAQSLGAAPTYVECVAQFGGTDDSSKPVTIAWCDDGLTYDDMIHCVFGPRGFTITLRRDGGAFLDLLTDTWRGRVACDGTPHKVAVSVRGDTITVIGPHGETYGTADARVPIASATSSLFWQATVAGTTTSALSSVRAVRRVADELEITRVPGVLDEGGLSGPFLTAAVDSFWEMRLGQSAASGLPVLQFGPSRVRTYLTAAGSIGAGTITTDGPLLPGTTTIGFGDTAEDVTVAGNPNPLPGAGYPYVATLTGTLAKNHAAGTYVQGAGMTRKEIGWNRFADYFTTTGHLSVGGYLLLGGVVYSSGYAQLIDNARKTGWTAATGNATRTTFATGSVTTAQLAERVKALIDDLISHGLIGA